MAKMIRTWALGAGLLLCVLSSLLAEPPRNRFRVDVWSADEGRFLPQDTVISLTQSRDGYLWLGTVKGLVRFDGLGRTTASAAGMPFPVYDDSNTPGLNSSPVVRLFEDSHTNLWIGNENAGVVLVRPGKVINTGIGRGTREGRLSAICEDAAGSVWLFTADGQLCRYRNGRVDVLNVSAEQPSNCRALMVDDTGLLWVGTDTRLWAVAPGASASLGRLPVVREFSLQKLDFLLASGRQGYWRLADGRIQKWRGSQLLQEIVYPWDQFKAPISAACEDAQGNLIVGTAGAGDGIYWFDAEGHYEHLTKAQGLSHNTVTSLCLDREGDLWVGTDIGLNRVKHQIFDVREESREWAIKSICPDAQGGLWLGSFGQGVRYLAHGTNQWFTAAQGLIDPNIVAVFVDDRQQVWAGAAIGGLYQLVDGVFRRPPETENLRGVSAFFQDHRHRLWVGTQNGLACYDGQTWQLLTTRTGLSGNIIRSIAEDREGNLWVGTEGHGLNELREGKLDGPCLWFGKTNGLPSDTVYALYADPQGSLWVGTSGGLARHSAGQWTSFSRAIGLANRSIGYLLEDARGNLWMGSSAGLLRAPKSALNDLAADRATAVPIQTFGKPEGLPTRACTQGAQPAACRDQQGQLWFPTVKGLVTVDPALITLNTNEPPVIIESVAVDGQPQGTNSLRSLPLESVTLPPGKETLDIDFTSLNLSAPDKGLFRYKLEEHERLWNDVQATTRSVRYSKLPPKQYRFRVIACNEDGIWNQAGSSLLVTVLPPFWQEWWFLTLVTLALLGLIVGSVHYVSTQKLQRQLVTLRQQEALEKERARIARDLHDQLGANLTQVALLGEMAESDKDLPHEVEGYAQQICQTARDTTRALDEIVWTVNPSNDTLDGLINYVCKYAQEYLALAGLRYRIEVPPQLPGIPITPELRHNVFLASKEAVNNVVKHAQATSAWLRLELEPSQFTLEIEDDGRGLAAGDEAKGRNGLRNMRRRMEDVGGRFEARPGNGCGTCIRLTAPIPPASAKPASGIPAPPAQAI